MAEPNNTLPTAEQIGSLTTFTVTDNVSTTDTIDYYKFTLEANGVLGTQLIDLTGNASVTIIRDFNNNGGIDDGDTIRSFSARENYSESREAEKGDYFIGVSRGLSNGGNYTLKLDFTPVPGNTDSNPGNGLSTALDLGSFTGTKILKEFIGITDTADFYKFTLDQNSSFGWQIQDLDNNATISLIRDVNKNGGIDSGDTLNSFIENENTVSNRELEAGEYFIGIEETSFSAGENNYTLQLDVNPVPANTPSNPGNDLNNALNIGSVTGTTVLKEFVGETDRLDYYKFTLDQNGAFGWQVQDLDTLVGVTLIKDLDKDNGIDRGEELQSFFDDETGVFNRQLEAGEYIFEVERSDTFSTNTNYTLQLDFTPIPATTPSNPGNDLSNALDLGVITSPVALTDFVGFTDGSDFYKFTLDRALTLSIQASNLVESLAFDLIQDLDGDRGIDSGETTNTIFTSSPETENVDLGAGEYFIRVAPSSDRNSNYTLTLTPPTSPPPATGSGVLDVDGDGQVTFSRDALLFSAFAFFNTNNRTDFSVLDRFINNPNADRKTGNAVADYLKGLLPSSNAAGLNADAVDVATDEILGTVGDDILTGNTGNNFIVGGAGNDLLTGDAGKDTFSFSAGSGNDKISDFQVAEDLIKLDSTLGFADSNAVLVAISYQGSTAELILSEGNVLTVEGDRPLTVDNFAII